MDLPEEGMMTPMMGNAERDKEESKRRSLFKAFRKAYSKQNLSLKLES